MEVHEYPLDTSVCYTSGDSPKRRCNLHARKSLSQFHSDVSNRFFSLSPPLFFSFFSIPIVHLPRIIREPRSQSRPFVSRGNVVVSVRLLSSSIDTVSSDSRRIYVPNRESERKRDKEIYRLRRLAFVRVRGRSPRLEIWTRGCTSMRWRARAGKIGG